ncbi:MAG: biotin--[acetyl-CoA-carboxylase] ligase [Oscillospiraceae bacterium]|nr:biotin--[acetyl-CoA-carboxylase] ligase [Oscillospiraceae bacterium]
MNTKEQLLALLERNKGVYFSGEEIAERLSISRTAVWKSVKALRNAGYQIDAVQNRGYCLSAETDILSVQGIQKYLKPVCGRLEIHVLPALDSTNSAVREKAMAGAPEGYTIIANHQTRGRGRSGRAFYSPPDTGIYMSLLLRPNYSSSRQAVKLTTMAAVATCEAIEAVSEEKAQIKWVNDISVRGKKVCGILTEASFSLEDGSLEFVVLGIGINVSPPSGGFPVEIKDIAGTVFRESQSDGKNRLTAEFLNRFMRYYSDPDMPDYVDNYRSRSMAIGKEIQVISPNGTKKAVALDVDQDCRLIVRYADGETESLYSGEISIRL